MKNKKIFIFLGLVIISLICIGVRYAYISDYSLLYDGDPYIYASDVDYITEGGFTSEFNNGIFPQSLNSRPLLFSTLLSIIKNFTNINTLDLVKYFSLFISTITTLFIFISSTYLFKKHKIFTAFITSFSFATISQFILRTSISVPENISILMFTVCLFFIIKFDYEKKNIFLHLALFLSIISIGFHLAGIFIFMMVLIYIISNFKNISNKSIFLINIILSFTLLFLAYDAFIRVFLYHSLHSKIAPTVFTPDIEPPITLAYYLNFIGPVAIILTILGYLYVGKSLYKDKLYRSLLLFSLIIFVYFEIFPRLYSFLDLQFVISVLPKRILTYFMLVPGIYFFGIALTKVIEGIKNKKLMCFLIFFLIISLINPLTWFWNKDVSGLEYEGIVWFEKNTPSDSFFITSPMMKSKLIFFTKRTFISNNEKFDIKIERDILTPAILYQKILNINKTNEKYLVLFKKDMNSPVEIQWFDSANLVGTSINGFLNNKNFAKVYENDEVIIFNLKN